MKEPLKDYLRTIKSIQECNETGWFIWNKNYEGFPKIKVLDMQKYIKGKREK